MDPYLLQLMREEDASLFAPQQSPGEWRNTPFNPDPAQQPQGGGFMSGVQNFFGMNPMGPGRVNPRGAAWGQALNNIAAMNMGQAPRVAPTQAYQQAVQQNAMLDMRQQMLEAQNRRDARQKRVTDLAIKKGEQALNPFYSYQQAIEQGYIKPEEVALTDWMTLAGKSDLPSAVREWKFYEGLPPERRAEYMRLKRSPYTVNMGGDAEGVLQPDNSVTPITTAPTTGNPQQDLATTQEQIAAADAAQAATIAGETEDTKYWVGQNNNFRQVMGSVPEIIDNYRGLEEALDVLESGGTLTGPLAGRIGALYDPDTAFINLIGMNTLIKTLAEVSTGAISGPELEVFSRQALEGTKSKEVNMRLAKEGMRLIERQLRHIQDKARYFNQTGTLQGYGETKVPDIEALLGPRGPQMGGPPTLDRADPAPQAPIDPALQPYVDFINQYRTTPGS